MVKRENILLSLCLRTATLDLTIVDITIQYLVADA